MHCFSLRNELNCIAFICLIAIRTINFMEWTGFLQVSKRSVYFKIYCLFSYQIFDDWFTVSDPRVTLCSEALMDFDLTLLLNFLSIDVIGNRIQWKSSIINWPECQSNNYWNPNLLCHVDNILGFGTLALYLVWDQISTC